MKNDENKKVDKVIDATTTEDTTQTEKPEKEGFFRKVGNGFKKVGNGIKKGLDKEVKLWQVIAAPIIIVGAVVGAKALYDKGRNDAMSDMDVPELPEIPEEPMALEVEEEPVEEEVVDVEDYEEEPEEVYEEEEPEEVYEEEIIEE